MQLQSEELKHVDFIEFENTIMGDQNGLFGGGLELSVLINFNVTKQMTQEETGLI